MPTSWQSYWNLRIKFKIGKKEFGIFSINIQFIITTFRDCQGRAPKPVLDVLWNKWRLYNVGKTDLKVSKDTRNLLLVCSVQRHLVAARAVEAEAKVRHLINYYVPTSTIWSLELSFCRFEYHSTNAKTPQQLMANGTAFHCTALQREVPRFESRSQSWKPSCQKTRQRKSIPS